MLLDEKDYNLCWALCNETKKCEVPTILSFVVKRKRLGPMKNQNVNLCWTLCPSAI